MSFQTQTTQTWDSTTGQDMAYKAAQERSALQAKNFASMYGGDISGLLSSISRIRDLQRYLNDFGLGGNDMAAIPGTRLDRTQTSTSQSGYDMGDYSAAMLKQR